MKTKNMVLSLLVIFLSVFSLSAQTAKASKNKKVLFEVSMHCESCQKRIEKNIAFEKGVKDLEVNLAKKTVEITYDTTKTTVDNLQKSIVKLGYEATVTSLKQTSEKRPINSKK